MTGLAGYTPKTETVEFPGGAFTVRGLSADDFVTLMASHNAIMSTLFDRFVTESAVQKAGLELTGGKLKLGDMGNVVQEAVKMAPPLMADVIAHGAGEPELAKTARLLPTGCQIDALTKIMNLTLEAEGGMEKLVEMVATLANSLASAVAHRSH